MFGTNNPRYQAPAGSSQGNPTGVQPMQGNASGGKPKFEGDKIPHGYKKAQIQNFTPEMLQMFSQMMGMIGPDSDLYRMAMGDQSAFEEMEQPAWRQFQEAQGELGSRFSGAGMGARKGSGFQNAAGQMGNDFAMGLQANRQKMMQQAMQDLMGYGNSLLGQKPYDRGIVEKQPSDFEKYLKFTVDTLTKAGEAAGKAYAGGG